MSAVIRLGYVHLRVTDLEEARNHYSNTLGMEVVHEEPGKLWLKCWDEWDHHSLVLEEGGVGLVKFGYKVEDDDALADFEHRAQQFGATTGRFSAGENLKVGDGRADHPAVRAHPRALLRHGVRRHRDRVRSTPRPGRGTCAGSARTGSTTP